jgi:hypothetical protein
MFGTHAGKTFLIALVDPCRTEGKDARSELTGYHSSLATVAVDVRDITAVVGRVQTRNQWYIIDQFDAAVPAFDERNDKNYSDGEESDEED